MAISSEQLAANGHANGHTNGTAAPLDSSSTSEKPVHPRSVPLNTQYGYTPRKLRIITIGAGFSGLLMAHKIQHRFRELEEYVTHIIFEMRKDIGGTWLVNDYPGVQCDVPAHIYAFPFDPNPNWTKFYASGPEIQAYIKSTVAKWNLDRDVQLNTRVVGARWNENDGVWKVTVERDGVQRDEFAEILISGQGVLCHPSWPTIPGLRHFKGKVVHSAEWDHGFDYSHKRIAVIGNGSSGIQITPQMANLPGTEVINFVRGGGWIYYRIPPSRHLGRTTDEVNPTYTEEEKTRFQDPEYHHQYRKGIIDRTNKAYKLFLKGKNNEEAVRFGTEQMAAKLNHDPELCRILIPKWEVGCRRVTPGPGYLEAFSKPNCNLTDSPITHISGNAVHTADGNIFECDVVVCATGFDVSHRPRFPLIGQNGANLAEKWADEPESYLSVATAGFPNYFIFSGPNSLGGHGSLVEALNWTGDYFVKWIKKIATEDIKSVVPKKSAEEAFVRYGDEVHKTIVWTGSCKSWYKRNKANGRVTALFGGSALLFNRLISDLRPEDFDIEYRSANNFRFLGNGFLEYEMDPEQDLSWYVELPEPLKQ
ncbi:hypothetical protein BDV33DRAFT_204369 [Aspergillus novoparasiticus]|uniref:FAD/NAD(P)-binding domain-containing protein n=1 Tax=Aspergillus novoparasiticus TaxID=986946 RepID=A0A5N6EPB9_9EURO|nr:hypothetical protein BDV33DRAFT_204369 [Aspergillus novoparasiticus]